ncbi:solute carrier family 49 member 4-like [Amphiura filiformis]|uniref:solute carrier family 49 member 4-like n=1 Tax=Amphiura filiformis TaxID=82378 RepID=UPI003B22761B
MWSGIISAFVCIPFAGIMDKFGIRAMFLLAETFALIGVLVRCLPVGVENLKWTANIGQFFIGLAGPFLVQGPSLVSSAWFPPHQRTTATAISSIAMELGMAASFIIGPLMVSDIKSNGPINGTLVQNETTFADVKQPLQVSGTIDPIIEQRSIDEIYQLLYIECDVLVFLYIIAWLYFPSKPPTPPSMSDTVAWIAFVTYISGVIGGLMTARWADYLGGRMRLVLLALTLPAIGIFVGFLLLVNQVIPFNLPAIYVTALTYGFLLNSTRPIYLEMICEGVYPVAEGITVGLLNWMNNCIGLTFLSGMLIPDIGVYWMNFAVLFSIIVTFFILVLFKEHSKRLAVDGQIQNDYELLVKAGVNS